MATTTNPPASSDTPGLPVTAEADLADEETVEEAIEDTTVAPADETGFEEEILPAAPAEHEGLDWFTPEDLEELEEGIGPPPEETLHDVDQLHEAILDEGEALESFNNNAVQAAVEEEEEDE